MVAIQPDSLRASYDFVIVGGGTAGLVLANRLSVRPDISVLVIEVGKHRPDDPKINTPGLMASMGDDPEYDWMFRTTPQKHLNGRVVGHSRGRVLGGSSALQYGMVVFPSKPGLDAWESFGNPGWSWNDMAPYYRKFHTLVPPKDESAQDLSLTWINNNSIGTTGPIQASFAEADFYGPLHKAWPKTFENLEYGITGDPMSGVMQGAYCNPTTVDAVTKSRSYATSAYYAPVATRPNLHILTETQVAKINLEQAQDEQFIATGVSWASGGQTFTVQASREVLLCAGTIQSPQILELSGIGDAKHLSKLGITPLIDNPNVGENMQDHALASISFEVKDGTPTAEALMQPGVMDAMIQQYNSNRSGPLTSSAICNAYMPVPEHMQAASSPLERQQLDEFIKLHASGTEATFPSQQAQYRVLRSILKDPKDSTVQYHLCAFQLNPHKGPGPSDWLGMKEEGNYLTIPANLSHPFSRGSIHIQSTDVTDPPKIDPNYLSHPLDLEILARHVKFSETIAKSPPLAEFVKPGGRRIPRDGFAHDLDKAKDLVRRTLVSTYHPSSTCAMMPAELGGVVDSRLIVHQTKNLRVVDASIFPLIPRGNIQTSVYAVAEKAADLILEGVPSTKT